MCPSSTCPWGIFKNAYSEREHALFSSDFSCSLVLRTESHLPYSCLSLWNLLLLYFQRKTSKIWQLVLSSLFYMFNFFLLSKLLLLIQNTEINSSFRTRSFGSFPELKANIYNALPGSTYMLLRNFYYVRVILYL